MLVSAHLTYQWGLLSSCTEELYKKDLQDPDNHEGVIIHTHLEPDILQCEVRWALESITMNKASGGDGIPVELFQILKDDAVKVLTQYASKFGLRRPRPRELRAFFSCIACEMSAIVW